jgi:hypothetical protein
MIHDGMCDSYNLSFKTKSFSMSVVTAELLISVSVMTTVIAHAYTDKT